MARRRGADRILCAHCRSCGEGFAVPSLSDFYGISIDMLHTDHGVPRFHARYGGFGAAFGIEPFRVLRGRLPRRAEAFVSERTVPHRAELVDDRNRGRSLAPIIPIDPLD